jgi:hypothetical protein
MYLRVPISGTFTIYPFSYGVFQKLVHKGTWYIFASLARGPT